MKNRGNNPCQNISRKLNVVSFTYTVPQFGIPWQVLKTCLYILWPDAEINTRDSN